MMNREWIAESVALLKSMIAIPSHSREEVVVADLLQTVITRMGYEPRRSGNNLWIESRYPSAGKPVLLLNSHIDTVKPAAGWLTDPYQPVETDGSIAGLGSNDAGASVVSLLAAFRHLDRQEQPYHLIFCASAEEEISGLGGVSSVLEQFGTVALGVVGEPTGMQMAVAEKGLLVLDCEATGRTGHAARSEGVNAIYKALEDIKLLREFTFPKESEVLGAVKMTITQIEAGIQHNVVPDRCRFVVDVRTNEHYTNREVADIISLLIESEVKPRSFRLNSSSIALTHPLVVRGKSLGLSAYGSPTTSDQAVMPFPTLKIGPGDSARSHTPNEFIRVSEIEEAVELYVKLLDQLVLN